MDSRILVLNYNGRQLLAECLPSVVEAAERAADVCRVGVVDNGSSDGSLGYLRRRWPSVQVFRQPNRGLASFNAVLRYVSEPVVFLLNNDVKLDAGFIDPMLAVFRRHDDCFLAGPLCWGFDGKTYEGMRTRVRLRRGLVEATARVPGYKRAIHRPGATAAVGPVLAVDRKKFLTLGGYDPIYFPGRIEDLDLGFRGWRAGWKAYYVPNAVAYHKGFGTFEGAFGRAGCDLLALRNTLLFIWKNLRAVEHLAGHFGWLPVRFIHSVLTAPWAPPERRLLFARALAAAVRRLADRETSPEAGDRHAGRCAAAVGIGRGGLFCTTARETERPRWRKATAAERAFFRQFGW
ncbi:MAG: glycosyltransferase [Pirellulales bacterium]